MVRASQTEARGSLLEATRASEQSRIFHLVRETFELAGYDEANVGTAGWNPLRTFIGPGTCVTIKPNWVFHNNLSGQGLDCLVTSASLLGAVTELVLRAKPSKVIIGDAPIQGCNLPALMKAAGYDELKRLYAQSTVPIEWCDFRRAVLANSEGVWDRHSSPRQLSDYVLFDLGLESMLEPIAQDAHRFRVTMYNPELMRHTHALGRHQYLIASNMYFCPTLSSKCQQLFMLGNTVIFILLSDIINWRANRIALTSA